MKNLFLVITTLLTLTTSFAQAPAIDWQKCLGGTNFDNPYQILQTTDGGYIVAGSTDSNDGDMSGYHGSVDIWVAKLSSTGAIDWQKCLGGTGSDNAYSIQQTDDGGYIVAGNSTSTDGDVSGNVGGIDVWIVKLSNTGAIQWQKCLGGTDNEYAISIKQTTDGGYIVAGHTESNDVNVYGNHGNYDMWVVKLSNTGVIQWQKCLGGTTNENAYSIQQTIDGGYIVAGYTISNDGNVSGNHGSSDMWVVKLSNTGVIQWQKCLGGTGSEIAYSIQQTTDGGYIVAGHTSSNDGDVSGFHGSYDIWVIKLSNSGAIQWQKCLGGTDDDYTNSVQQTTDGGYIVAGYTRSNNGDVSGNHGDFDMWVLKLNSNGTIQWKKCLGGTGNEQALSIEQTTDGGYIVAGFTTSNDGDVSGNHGDYDIWVVRLVNNLGVDKIIDDNTLLVYPNPAENTIYVQSSSIFNKVELKDLNGKVISVQNVNDIKTTIDISKLNTGIYLIEVQSELGRSINRVVKN